MDGEENHNTKQTYEVSAQEISVDWNGFNFLVIYGKHKNGWFIAIPNWNVCTESGHPSDECYNATKLARAHFHDEAPVHIARAVMEHWEESEREDKNGKND